MNRKILIIEDEANIQELLRYNLEKNGYIVTISDNGIDGLQKALDQVPDLILLDLMLPGLDGLEVCKRLRMQKAKDFLDDARDSYTRAVSIIQTIENVENDILR